MSKNKRQPAFAERRIREMPNAIARALSVCLFLALCASLLGSALIDPATLGESGIEYETVPVIRGDYVRTVMGSASLTYPIMLEVRCKLRNARLTSIYLSRSEELTEGQQLGVLESEGSQAELTQARLALQRSEEDYRQGLEERRAEIEKAERDIALLTDATAKDIARLRLEQKRIELEAYVLEREYAIAAQRKRVTDLEESLMVVTLTAPVTGIIKSFSNVNEGDSIAYNKVLLTMTDASVYLLRIEDDGNKFRYGMHIEVSYGPRNNRSYCEAVIVSADNVLSFSEHTGYAYAAVIEPIPAEDLTMINVTGDQVRVENVLLIPKKASMLESGKNYVSILGDGSVAKRYVNIALSNVDSSWILQGLTEGQTLILD